MAEEEEVWEDRKVHPNGHGGYEVNVPKSWLDVPAEKVFRARIVYEKRNGKRTIRLVFPGEEGWT